jgi:hypothetical protein
MSLWSHLSAKDVQPIRVECPCCGSLLMLSRNYGRGGGWLAYKLAGPVPAFVPFDW